MTRPQAVLWGTLSVAAHALVLTAWPVPRVTPPDEPVAVEVGLVRSPAPPSAGGAGGLPGKAEPAAGRPGPPAAAAQRPAAPAAAKPVARSPRPRRPERAEQAKSAPPVLPEPAPRPEKEVRREPPRPRALQAEPPPPAPPPLPREAEPPPPEPPPPRALLPDTAPPAPPPAPRKAEPPPEPSSALAAIGPAESSPPTLPAKDGEPAEDLSGGAVPESAEARGDPGVPTGGDLATAAAGGGGAPGPGGGGTSRAPQVEAAPDYSENPRPSYPWIARRRGWEGEVRLRVRVSNHGRVLEVSVERSSGHPVLDDAALKTVSGWRFRPALTDGAPVESTVLVPLRFALKTPE